MNIKPIETSYKGCLFRSRLEARWAVFFDAIGTKWEYEKEGFELGNGERYLPDFWLPDIGTGIWFEVKGEPPTLKEINKLVKLCEGTDNFGCIAWGTMDVPYVIFRELHDGTHHIDILGSKMLSVVPPSEVIGHHPDGNVDIELKNRASTMLYGFYEDPKGEIYFDRLYLNDIEFSKETKVTQTFSVCYIPEGIPIFYKDGVMTGFMPMRVVNGGNGRKYRSARLQQAYKKARSARFERF